MVSQNESVSGVIWLRMRFNRLVTHDQSLLDAFGVQCFEPWIGSW